MVRELLKGRRPVLVDPEHRYDLRRRRARARRCGASRAATACLARPGGARGALTGESSLSAEAICARLEALELTRSSCDLNSQSETPAGLSWQALDGQISN